MALTPGDGPDNDEGLFPRCNRLRQRSVRRLMGQILLAGKEAQERSPLMCDLIADGAAQHGIAGFKRVKNGTLRDRAFDVKLYLAANLRQGSEMVRDYHADHICVINSVFSTKALICSNGPRARTTMRVLNILSGVAVVFTTLAFAHLLHHHLGHAPGEDVHSLAFVVGFTFAVVVGILSFIGACLLIRRGR